MIKNLFRKFQVKMRAIFSNVVLRNLFIRLATVLALVVLMGVIFYEPSEVEIDGYDLYQANLDENEDDSDIDLIDDGEIVVDLNIDDAINEAINSENSSDSVEQKEIIEDISSIESEVEEYDLYLAVMTGVEELSMPASGVWTKSFGYLYDKTWDDYRLHTGLDMALDIGTEVYASLGGIVEIIEDDAWGDYVSITHGESLVTVYKCIEVNSELVDGSLVETGDLLGWVCESSLMELDEVSHLHFEVVVGGELADPKTYL